MKAMLKVIKYPAEKDWPEIIQRPSVNYSLLGEKIKRILKNVKAGGDEAVKKYTKKFDGVKLKRVDVTEKEIEGAEKFLSIELRNAIQQAKQNIERFHQQQFDKTEIIETVPGVKCWRRSVGIEKVGIYIPGGTAPLFSTVLMLAIPATIAGCEEIILCTPSSKDATIHPAILYAAGICGVKKIFKIGGAQAIAAMAYGTETVPKVFKIFGPGNQYVTCAKQLIQQEGVAIDMPAGPSELLIIADNSAIPEFVAADLLSQAEHGADSQVILVTTSKSFIEKVITEIKKQIKKIARRKIAEKALKNSKIVLLDGLEQAIDLSNQYAPEHLILAIENPEMFSDKIVSAGSVFFGNYSPESAGDYASGTNHVLPTNGYASMYSGVSVETFVKKITYQQLTKEGLENISDTVMEMAEAEGLEAHKNAIAIRLNK